MPDATDVQVEANWLYNIFVSEDAGNVHMDLIWVARLMISWIRERDSLLPPLTFPAPFLLYIPHSDIISPHAHFSPHAHIAPHFSNTFPSTSSWQQTNKEYDYNAFRNEIADCGYEIQTRNNIELERDQLFYVMHQHQQ